MDSILADGVLENDPADSQTFMNEIVAEDISHAMDMADISEDTQEQAVIHDPEQATPDPVHGAIHTKNGVINLCDRDGERYENEEYIDRIDCTKDTSRITDESTQDDFINTILSNCPSNRIESLSRFGFSQDTLAGMVSTINEHINNETKPVVGKGVDEDLFMSTIQKMITLDIDDYDMFTEEEISDILLQFVDKNDIIDIDWVHFAIIYYGAVTHNSDIVSDCYSLIRMIIILLIVLKRYSFDMTDLLNALVLDDANDIQADVTPDSI